HYLECYRSSGLLEIGAGWPLDVKKHVCSLQVAGLGRKLCKREGSPGADRQIVGQSTFAYRRAYPSPCRSKFYSKKDIVRCGKNIGPFRKDSHRYLRGILEGWQGVDLRYRR